MSKKRTAYEKYINGPHWAARKRAFWNKHPRVCRGCESTDDVQLHHGTYQRMGTELDSDLFPVCQICHQLIHDLHRISNGKLDLMQATVMVLSSVKNWKANPHAKPEPPPPGRKDPINGVLQQIKDRRRALLNRSAMDAHWDSPME